MADTTMPADATAMHKHLAAAPPAGHGAAMPADAPVADMTAMHDAKHSADTPKSGHSHSAGRSHEPIGFETRNVAAEWEWRETPTGGIESDGYAATFSVPSAPLPWIETIEPGAFKQSIGQHRDITLNLDHNPERLLSSLRAKTLVLEEDSKGLHYHADMAPTSYGRDLKILADRDEIHDMSFAFKAKPKGEAWGDDGRTRSLSEVRLFHISILTGESPAYPKTEVHIRSLEDLAGRLLADLPSLEAAITKLNEGEPLTAAECELICDAAKNLSGMPEMDALRIPMSLRAAQLAVVRLHH